MNLKALLLSTALTVGMTAVAFGQSPSSTSPQSQDPSAQQDPAATQQTPGTPTQTPRTSTQQPDASNPSANSSATSTSSDSSQQQFTGSIAKMGGKYVLHSAGADYQLDDQSQAKSFEGKDVKVTGRLDSSSNTIKVKSIEPSSSM